MLINYALLPTLRELGAGRSFAETARRLRLTPSAVSHQMRALEAQVGFRLFERVGRRAKLSPEAQRLATLVATHLAPIDDALEALLDGGKQVRGPVRIGGALPFSRLWLRPRLTQLLTSYPELELSVSFGPPSQLLPKLQAGQLDFAIVAEGVESPLLSSQSIYVEEFWAVCSPQYLAGRRRPEVARDWAEHRFLIYDDNRPMHDTWWRSVVGRRAASPANVACAIANLDEMLHLAEQGFGIAILPNYLVEDAIAAGRLVHLGARKKAPQNPLHVVWRSNAIATSRFETVQRALLTPGPTRPRRQLSKRS